MEHQVTLSIEHMAKSHQELARLLEAKRDIVVHLSDIINALPDGNISFCDKDDMIKSCSEITTNVVSYLNSIGDLEEALADNLSCVMKEFKVTNTNQE